MDIFLSGFDAAITPPAPGQAPADLTQTGDPAFCTIWSLCGVPAVTIPAGQGPQGLPLGLQLIGPRFADDRVLSIAKWCDETIGWPKRIAGLANVTCRGSVDIRIGRQACAVAPEGGKIVLDTPAGTCQIMVVEVEIEQVNVPGGLERIFNVTRNDLAGDGQGGFLGVVVHIPVFRLAQLLVLLGHQLVEETRV